MANIEKLRKLADHLLHGKLGHKRFDFTHYNSEFSGDSSFSKKTHCGTNGCAIGECPIAFPEDWFFTDVKRYILPRYLPVLKKKTTGCPMQDACLFFKLNCKQYYHLFTPNSRSNLYPGIFLDEYATKEQVAENIIQFCDFMEKNINNAEPQTKTV